ncbi:hypothetical protein GN956_G12738 [Arapaima gigas]
MDIRTGWFADSTLRCVAKPGRLILKKLINYRQMTKNLLEQIPMFAAIRNEMLRVKQKMEEEKEREKKTYAKMFA